MYINGGFHRNWLFYFYYNTLQRTIFINCFDLKMPVSVKIARSKIIML